MKTMKPGIGQTLSLKQRTIRGLCAVLLSLNSAPAAADLVLPTGFFDAAPAKQIQKASVEAKPQFPVVDPEDIPANAKPVKTDPKKKKQTVSKPVVEEKPVPIPQPRPVEEKKTVEPVQTAPAKKTVEQPAEVPVQLPYSDPAKAKPIVTEKPVVEPAVVQPAVTEPVVTEPAVTESNVAKPAARQQPVVTEKPVVEEPAAEQPAEVKPAALPEVDLNQITVSEPAVESKPRPRKEVAVTKAKLEVVAPGPRYQSDLPANQPITLDNVKAAIQSDDPGDDGDGAGFICPTPGACKVTGPAKNPLVTIKNHIDETVMELTNKQAAERANRLSQAAWASASKCRDFATYKKRRLNLSTKKAYNSCKIFGKLNAYKSKGLCGQGVREALAEVGVKLTRPADAHKQRPNLLKGGLIKTKYDPYNVPSGTVLICDGGKSSGCGKNGKQACGHIEIAIVRDGERRFCSDYCSAKPQCSKKNLGYKNLEAYKFPGT